ncbi:MAG: hypothetical protein K8R36_07480 [Planctomycetales bacterium]|nr:hypothetical protein [Planctomycetales bacterium]
MSKTSLLLASLFALVTPSLFAQVVVTSRPVVTYYAPAVTPIPATLPVPVETYYAPAYTTSRVVYDAPITVSRPVTTYYAPLPEAVPVSSYVAPTVTVAPTTAYYAPVTTYYGGAVVAPVYGSPVVVGRSAYGTLRPYIPGQPVRNTLRFAFP